MSLSMPRNATAESRSPAPARALETKLKTLVLGEPDVAARIVVKAIGRVGRDLHAEAFGAPKLVSPETVRTLISEAAKSRPKTAKIAFFGEHGSACPRRRRILISH